jgi:hypothetical protein
MTGCWCHTPVILATSEAEIRRIEVGDQPRKIVRPYLQNNQSKMDWRYGSHGTVPALQV